MVSSDVRITGPVGAVARQTALRAVQSETKLRLLAVIVILGRICEFKTVMFKPLAQKFKKHHLLRDCEEA